MPNPADLELVQKVAYELLEGDIMTFGQFYFKNHFSKESPRFHYEMLIKASRARNIAIASPRRSAKSTLLSFLYPFHKIIFKKEPFIVLISNTFKKAAMYLDTIKMELQDNARIKQHFPGLRLSRDAEGDSIFAHQDGFKTQFLCKGVDQIGSLRGVKFGPNRPGLIIGDDMEDDELVRSPERRLQLQNEFDEVLGKVGHDRTQFVVVGTILHDDSQLAKLVDPNKYHKFKKVIYRAHINPDKRNESSLWPQNWSLPELREMRKKEPNVYAKEMQNDPVAGSNVRFKREDFRYWKEAEGGVVLLDKEGQVLSKYKHTELKAAISCDLAWKEKRDNDRSVILPGFLTPNSEILIDTYIAKRGMRPDQIEEELFMLVDRLEKLTKSVVPIGFEKAMLENVTQWLLRRAMQKRNKFLLTRELTWDGDKIFRIETRLQSRYAQHVIFHRHDMGDLEHELERFPSGVTDDIIDAEQGLVQLLQYPKGAPKSPKEDNAFDRLRQSVIDRKKGVRWHGFGHRQILRGIPAKKSIL